MKTNFFVFFLLMVGCNIRVQSQGVIAQLELNVTDSREFGKLLSFSISLENKSGQSIYLDGIYPPPFEIYKQRADGSFENFRDGWLSNEINNPNRELIGKLNNQDTDEPKVYDSHYEKFIDHSILKFYEELLKKNSNAIKSRADTTEIRKWVKFQAEQILFLGVKQIYKSTIGINSLPQGVYKFFLVYSNRKNLTHQMVTQNKSLNLELPELLKEHNRWRGEIKSDTLYLNIR